MKSKFKEIKNNNKKKKNNKKIQIKEAENLVYQYKLIIRKINWIKEIYKQRIWKLK